MSLTNPEPHHRLVDRKRLKQLGNQPGLDPDLLRIYRDADGRLPDISRLQIHRPNWSRRIWFSVAGLLLVTVGGIWVSGAVGWVTSARHEDASIVVAIEAPRQLSSGEEVTYRISYVNIDRVSVNDGQLTLRYPGGFSFLRATPRPVNQYQNTWELPRLEPGARGEILLTAKVVGKVGSVMTLAGTVTYQPANFSSSFKSEFLQSSQITASIVTLDLSAPDRVVAEREITATVRYANTSDRALGGVLIQVRYPAGFVVRRTAPAPKNPPVELDRLSGALTTQPNSSWYLASLPAHASSTLTITGGFVAGAAGPPERELTAQVGFVDETGSFSVQQEQRTTLTLLETNLQLNVIINGSAADQSADFGEVLQYRIVYKNLGSEPLGDIVVQATIDSTVVDWATLAEPNLGQRDGSVIRWDKSSLVSLTQIGPLEEGTLDFSLQLKPGSAVTDPPQNLQTVSAVEARIGTVGGIPAERVVRAGPITTSVNTAVAVDAQGRYFDDDNLAVGSGPLPPVAGQTTTFRIYWSLSNSVHPAEQINVSTALPVGVEWANKLLSSTGQLSYQAAVREVSWKIDQLAARKNPADVVAWFDVAVTPKPDQVGKLLLLTSETTLTARDAVTKASIVGLERSITSNLEDDPFGGGRGLVVELGE